MKKVLFLAALLLVCFSGVTNTQTRKQREDAKRDIRIWSLFSYFIPAPIRLIRDVCTCLKSISLRPGVYSGARRPYSPR